MKISAAVALSFFLVASAEGAQNHATAAPDSAAASASQSKIDPAKEADIRHLLDAAGTVTIVQQVMHNLEQNLKPTLAGSLPPGEYRDRLVDLFFEKFRSKFDGKRILDLAVVRYDENFSDEEIKGLITFYQTPLGQKVVNLLPKLTTELQQDGQRIGQQVGRDSMVEVLSEHPDIAQALQEASRRTAPPSR
jgi:hypothetical protein